MKKTFLKSLIMATMFGFYAFCATAATSLFSDYGQIQNVQHYSTNPFWTPNAPYNQRLPQPVYVQGADLNAEDCFKVVQSLVSVQCMARDNCKNTTLAEIRPTVMVQLSNLPGNNYVSACSGYIDGVFEQYVAQYGNSVPNRAVAFPNATQPNQNLNNDDGIQIQNPYQMIPNQWQKDYIERSKELQQLQQQNGAGSEKLSANAFPTTFQDLSFSERMAVKTEGYEPYKDASAYVIPDFKTTAEWCGAGGKGAGTAECNKKISSLSSGGNTDSNNNLSDNQPTYPKTDDKTYTMRACYYPQGNVASGCANSRVSNGANWYGGLCISFCDVNSATDDLNNKVLFPIMNNKYCVDKSNDYFQIVELESRQPIVLTEQQYNQVKAKILSDLTDKDACDWGYLNLDILFGTSNSGKFLLVDNVTIDD